MSESDLELYGIVGKMLRDIRESKGYTLEVAAEHLGVAPISLQRYECGKRKIKLGTIEALCDFYGISYDKFIKEAKAQFSSDDGNNNHYYLDDDAREMAQFLFENPEYRVLFDASRKVKKGDIEFVKQMIDRVRGDVDDTGC